MTLQTIEPPCVACKGSGKASNGATCFPCQGSGKQSLEPNLGPYRAAFGDHAGQLEQAKHVIQMLGALTINNDADYQRAGEWLTTCKSVVKQHEEKRKAITAPLNQAKREVDSWFKPIVQAYQQAEALLKRALLGYQSRQLAERQRIAAEMAAQHAAQNTAGMMQLAAQAQQTQTPQVEGVQNRKVKRWRVVNEQQIPREYWTLDEQKIRTAMRDGTAVPGIEYYEESVIAASAR